MLFILDKKLEVVDTLSNQGETSSITPFFEDEYKQYLGTGAETFSFQTLANTREAQHLVVGNYIAFRYDNKYKLFHITQIEEEHTEEFVKSVYCEMAGIELINEIVRPVKFSGNLKKFLTMILADTEWSVGKVDSSFTDIHDIDISDYSTVYALIQEHVVETFGGEVELVVNITNGSVVSKQVNVYVTRGNDNGFRFSYSSNISSIKRSVDTSELCTALIGVGKDNLTFKEVETADKPLNQDFLASESAYKQWSKNGSHIMGVATFDTESPHELLRLTREELEKRIEPKVKYELATELITGDEVKIGDTVYVVDLEFNPPIQLQARVSELTVSFTDKSRNECVLSNFVEIGSNITAQMKKMASKLEGYVDSSINAQYPLSGDKISENAIKGSHIQQNTITADLIQAGQINADHIEANSINAGHIQANQIKANHIDAGQIMAEHIEAGQIKSEHIETGTLDAGVINADTVNADLIKGVVVEAINLYAQSADIDKALIDSAVIDSGQIAELVVKNLKVGNAQITDLEASKIKVGDLIADVMSANSITAINMNVSNATIDSAKIGELTADKITASVIDAINANIGEATINSAKIGDLSADKITSGEINTEILKSNIVEAINLSVEQATIDSAKIGELSADKITSGDISTDRLVANVINAINSEMQTATINSARIGDLTADKIVSGDFHGDRITAGTIKADRISTDALNSISVSASEMVADKIVAGEIKVTDANIIDGTISGAKITKASIGSAQIEDLSVTDAHISELNANKITAGTIDTQKVSINSTSGNLSIVDNTIQIKDNQEIPKVRVQIGKDSTDNYGIIVLNKDGKAIFDSDRGVLNEDGIASNVISEDKIVDGAVTPSKIQIDELWANEAFVNHFKVQEIDAGKITTGTISGERIDISGLISFASLGTDFSGIFGKQPVYKPVLDEEGNPTFDEEGNPIYETQKDENGDIIYDEEGNPQYVIMETKTYIDGGFILTDTIEAGQINLKKGFLVTGEDKQVTFSISEKGEIQINGLLQSGNYDEEKNQGYRISTDGTAILNQAKIRGDIYLPNAGMTDYNSDELIETNPTRIWAGASFENREYAPFRVHQDGSLFATDGTFSGSLYGEYNNGNIHLHENEIVINSIETSLDEEGNQVSVQNRHYNPNPFIRLGEGTSIINTDLILGTVDNPNVSYLIDDQIMFNIKSQFNASNGNVDMNSSTVDTYYAMIMSGSMGGQHEVKYRDTESGLVFNSAGSNSGTENYDFRFERMDNEEDVFVDIQGTLNVKTGITSSGSNIEMRSVENEGWGFYVN